MIIERRFSKKYQLVSGEKESKRSKCYVVCLRYEHEYNGNPKPLIFVIFDGEIIFQRGINYFWVKDGRCDFLTDEQGFVIATDYLKKNHEEAYNWVMFNLDLVT